MRLKIFALLLMFFSIGVNYDPAQAAEVNSWHVPGTDPLSRVPGGRDPFAINCAMTALSVPSDVPGKFKAFIDSGQTGELVHLKDGDRFSQMTFGACKVWPNVETDWGLNATFDTRMEVVTIVANDGTIVKYGRPYACNNWSIIDVSPPPRRNNCFVIPFDHGATPGVIRETTAQYLAQASGSWPSAAQADLNPDTSYTYVLAHIAVNAAEYQRLKNDQECFGVHDATGFHQGVMHCVRFCPGGQYPPSLFIQEYARKTGVQLPGIEPDGSFQFVCAQGKCELYLPLWAANRFGMYCVAVKKYFIRDAVAIEGFNSWQSNFRFDIVTSEQGERSLKRGKRLGGNVVLVNDSGRPRSLSGELAD